MDHKAFLTRIPQPQMARLTLRSDIAGLRHFMAHIGLILCLGTLIALQVPGWWLLLPVQGIALIFLFTLEHEATHKTPFANELLNETVGRLCGILIILPFAWFRYFHLAHHRYTNLPGKDPELAEPKPTTWTTWVWHVSGIPVWRAQIKQLANNALGRDQAHYVPPRAIPRIQSEAQGMIVVYALVAVSLLVTPLLFWVWLLPLVLGQPFLRLYLLAEHGRCPEVANMFDNTRTTFTNRIVRFLAWNMPYHVEHHVAPNIPFHQLPEFHKLTKAHLNETEDGYAKFTAKWMSDL